MTRLQVLGDKRCYVVTIPKEIVQQLKWKKGTELEWKFMNKDDGVVVRKKL